MKIDSLARTGKVTNLESSAVTGIRLAVGYGGKIAVLELPVSSNPQGDAAECQAAREALHEFALALAAAAKSLQ